MTSISTVFSKNHHSCDALFAAAEESAAAQNWNEAKKHFFAFEQAMEHHFSVEEDDLFPAFEAATGMTGGPTTIMRMEHQQIRGLLAEMTQDIEAQNSDDYLGHSETLLILMQQHNAKEEQVLYPVADQALGNDKIGIISALTATERF
jgi:hemerythrin-like domain-containing protein